MNEAPRFNPGVGLKDHILSNKRLSTGGGSSVPMGKLSRRSPPEDDVVNPKTNYLYPKKPSSRMGKLNPSAQLLTVVIE